MITAGCDEAGRGPLAGPVFAAAVVLPPGWQHSGINDSKQLTERQRDALRPVIEAEAVAWAVASCSAAEIDRINILQASILAMHRALDLIEGSMPNAQCSIQGSDEIGVLSAGSGHVIIEHVEVDGNRFRPWRDVPYTTVVHGDALLANIAAASILAKTYRDAYMLRAHAIYPQYGWDHNKGYPTRAHREAIRLHGPTPLHRLTFKF